MQLQEPTFRLERKKRLIASNFGAVVKRRSTTLFHNLLNLLIYNGNTLCTPAMNYGKENEINTIRKFEYQTGNSVRGFGLFIDLKNGFLGASPDGLIDDAAIFKEKWLYKLRQYTSLLLLLKHCQVVILLLTNDMIIIVRELYFKKTSSHLHFVQLL